MLNIIAFSLPAASHSNGAYDIIYELFLLEQEQVFVWKYYYILSHD